MSDMDEGDSPLWGRFCVQCACQVMVNAPETGRSGLLEACPECGCVAHEERSEYDGADRPKPHDYVPPACNWLVSYRYRDEDKYQEVGLFTEVEKERCVRDLLSSGNCHSISERQLTEEELSFKQLRPAFDVESWLSAQRAESLSIELIKDRLKNAKPFDALGVATAYIDLRGVAHLKVQPRGLPLCTRSGRMFYPLDPRAEDIRIEDIAHHLSHLCRFAGATVEFYSVCEHSVRGTLALAKLGCSYHQQLVFLLHDAAEAYCIDLPRPLKRALPEYERIENDVSRCVYERFECELTLQDVEIMHIMDNRMLSTERRDLMPSQTESWPDMLEPLHEKIVPWSSRAARIAYLGLFHRLTDNKYKEG